MTNEPIVESRLDHARPRGVRSLWASLPPWTGALVALLVLGAWTTVMEPAFIRPTNLLNILNQHAEVGIIAVGMTIVIISAGIDLSVGSLMAFAGGLGVLTLNTVYNGGEGNDVLAVLLAIGVMIGVATAAGALTGALVAWGRVAPFIATLGGLVAYRSAATWIAGGGQFFSQGSPGFAWLRGGVPIPGTNIAPPNRPPMPLEISFAVLLLVVVAIIGWVLLNRTRFGRYTIAVGASERAATYSAIPVQRIKLLAYTFIGFTAGLAALVHALRFQSVNSANSGMLIELEVIAAVVIGGTRMEGGSGSIVGTLIGVLLIGVIKNMLVLQNVTSFAHGLVMGLIIVGAVLVQHLGRRRGA
jgi:ribose transport system permease protein